MHDGFYLSMALGGVFGPTSDKVKSDEIEFSGIGVELDFKIGGAIKENFILHATITSKAVTPPDIYINGNKMSVRSGVSFGEVMYGIGVTRYFMPSNMFLSGSLGVGRFLISDGSTTSSTKFGPSGQIKIGKEWWVSKNWGLGVGVTYAKTYVNESSDETINSNRFSILFNATFN